jgi:hypothetical protein
MGKQSRRQRKQLREKRDHAESHGLAVREVPAPKRRQEVIAASAGPNDGFGATSSAGDGALASPTSAKSRGWSSWPISIQMLLVRILVLVGVGLYRRYTEAKGSEPTPLGSAQHPQ